MKFSFALLCLFLFFSLVACSSFPNPFKLTTPDKHKFDFLKGMKPPQGKTVFEPIILVPGDPGSYLEAKLTNIHPPKPYCRRNSDWFLIYPNTVDFLPAFIDCLVQNIRLEYNATNNTFSNATGVEIRPVDFGGFQGAYFDVLVVYFQTIGYRVGINLFCNPWDWRPDGGGLKKAGSFALFQNLIEFASARNNGSRVHLLTHSGGGPYTHYFLTKFASQQWKDKYVASFISMGSPWLGTTFTSAFLVNLGAVTAMGPDTPAVQSAIRSFGSIVWNMPSDKYDPEIIVLSTPSVNYTANMSLQMLQAAGANLTYEIRKNNLPDYNDLPAPNVTLYCIYGYGLETIQSYVFKNDNFTELIGYYNVSGDTIVSLKSGAFCETWKTQQTYPVVPKAYLNMSHDEMPFNAYVFNYILNITTH